ncbi:MAG: WXG100 family type VII secretion target [Clostridiales bacterium]|nr:WXG100 family type VII secretion target [Clostridiales bacterium]
MTTDRLVAKPSELRAKASEVQTERARISDALTTALNEIQSLSATWQSEGAEAYRNSFKKQYDELQNILSILDRHVRDLTATADTFAGGESSVTSKNEALPVVSIAQ